MSDSRYPPTVVWLVRHGETDWNATGRIQGHADHASLTEEGRRQALMAARQLGTKPVRALYASDLRRARQTASTIAGELGCTVGVDDRLRERSFGSLEGLDSSRLTPEVTGIDHETIVDPAARPPGGETLDEVWLRCAAFLGSLSLQANGGEIVVVAHGGSIRMLQLAAEGLGPAGSAWSPVANASIHRLLLPSTGIVDSPPMPVTVLN
jgi:probable phosphoglycerate mutase